ncbi:M1-specific T cell receptor beta chain-like [Tachysurus fulvidraco]|uniref:M1-specific T cell receptor beta chain-like n=1 Tax=Tachysurus fulvidraco TaxID=1234273 RepID=UPI001FED4565|nr:M1-specific T cell receptor beta chain-like [Tachysurus fulvidraco]
MELVFVGFALLITARSLHGVKISQNPTALLKKAGESVEIKCQHDDSTHYYMYWYRQRSLGEMDLITMSLGKDISQTVEPFNNSKYSMIRTEVMHTSLQLKKLEVDDSAVYFCASSSTVYNSIKITEPKRVSLLNVSENEVCTKTNVTLVCVAEGFYPDHVSVSWSVDGEKRETDVSTDEAAIQNVTTNFYSISSRLNINYKDEWTKGKEFTCTVSFFNGTVYTEHSDSYRSPKKKYIQSANVTMLAYGMFIGKSIAYGLFILYVIKRQCDSFADLKFGPGTRLTVLEPNMTITPPTVTLMPPSPKELCKAQGRKGKVTLVCLATHFYPDHVSIIWQVNEKERNNGVATDHVAQQNINTSFYSMSSRLHVNHTEWTNVKNKFTCIISFYNGSENEEIQTNIAYSPGKIPVRVYLMVQFGYMIFISKSLLYAVFVSILVWMCKPSKEKTVMTENGDIVN